MRTKSDLEAIHASGTAQFGYVDISMFDSPPFVMFTNGNDCGICESMLQSKPYEPESTRLWAKLASVASSMCDIGTRCGEYTLIAAAVRNDIPIIACEPNPDGYARLMVNLRANDVRNVIAHRYAVAHKDGFMRFEWQPKWFGHISSGGHLVPDDHSTGNTSGKVILTVETMSLDKIVAGIALGPHPAIKIDVEGAERAVFKGMQKVLQLKPDIIVETFSAEACEAMMAHTANLDYRYYFIEEDEGRIVPIERLIARDARNNSRNQFLSARPEESVLSWSSRAGQ